MVVVNVLGESGGSERADVAAMMLMGVAPRLAYLALGALLRGNRELFITKLA